MNVETGSTTTASAAIRPTTLDYAGLLCTTSRELDLQFHSLRHLPLANG